MTTKIKNLELKILSIVFALAMLVGSGYGVVTNLSNNDTGFSALVLANAEALANDESPGGGEECETSYDIDVTTCHWRPNTRIILTIARCEWFTPTSGGCRVGESRHVITAGHIDWGDSYEGMFDVTCRWWW